MKLVIRNLKPFNLKVLLRQCGYHLYYDRRMKKDNYVRRLGNSFYPRFHLHPQEVSAGVLSLDLHLDMLAKSIGSRRHGLTNEELVAEEMARIKEIILSLER